jgi:hypothetical protein
LSWFAAETAAPTASLHLFAQRVVISAPFAVARL